MRQKEKKIIISKIINAPRVYLNLLLLIFIIYIELLLYI